MNARNSALLLFSLALVGAGCEPASSPVESTGPETTSRSTFFARKNAVPDEYVVVLKDEVAAASIDDVVSDLAGDSDAEVEHTYKRVIKGFSATMSAAAAERLANDSRVKYVEPNYEITLPPDEIEAAGNGSGAGDGGNQITPWGVTRVGGSHNGRGKTAWIIDSGIDLDNRDLNVDVARSRSFLRKKEKEGKAANDKHGHGTHVAGIVAAKNNGRDVVGVAAGATVVSVRVLNKDAVGTTASLIAGIDYVAENACEGDVANISISAPATKALDKALRSAAARGVIFSLAAGNSAADASLYSPARVNATNVYTVSAIGAGDVFWSSSNYGSPVDYAAPGVSIPSLRIGGGITFMTGTSMAAPHLTGLLLLGSVTTNGTAVSDPDGTADPIAHY